MRVADVVAELGLAEPDGQELIFAQFGANGGARHYTLRDVAERDVAEQRDLYLATGTFAAGAVGPYEGRRRENLRAILLLPFDADLADFLGCPKADLYGLDDETIMRHVAAQRGDLERVFARLDLPIHRLDYTGYGLCAYVRVAPELQGEIGLLQSLHKRLIRAVNAAWGGKLVDPQASDAGTRVTRVPGVVNGKGPIPRRSRTLSSAPGALGAAQARSLARDLAPEPTPIRQGAEPNPEPGKGLSRADADAIAAALAPHWTEGGRHALALGLAGVLAKAGVREADAEALVGRLAADDEQARDRLTAVADTYRNHAAGIEVKGYTLLKEAAGAAADTVDALLARHRRASGARLRQRDAAPDQAPEPDAPLYGSALPAAALRGLFGEYVALMRPTTEAPDAFHLGVALTFAGAMLGRGAFVHYGRPTYANLYTCLVGPTGQARKDTAMGRGLGFSRALGEPPFHVAYDVISAEGILDTLNGPEENGAHANTLWYMTEFSMLLRRARRESTATILSYFIKLWDTPDVAEAIGRAKKVRVLDPFVSILAATTPETLAGDMGQGDVGSGFANRFLFFAGTADRVLDDPPRVDRTAQAALAADLAGALAAYAGRAEPFEFEKEPPARALWKEWYHANHALARRGQDSEAQAQVRERMGVNIHKMALLYAATERAGTIRAEHLAAAMALAGWCEQWTREAVDTWGESNDARIERKVEEKLEALGAMKRYLLQRQLGGSVDGPAFSRVLKAMEENGKVVISGKTVGLPEHFEGGDRDNGGAAE